MASPSEPLRQEDSPAAAAKPKSTWETVLTLTPVILTVLATLLAGVSSSEMTLAQYDRTLAGQSQSKAGDQWAFFQAKRIRGQGMESSLDLFPVVARFGLVTPQVLQTATGRLVQRLNQAQTNADRLQQAVATAEGDLGEARTSIRQACAALVQTTSEDTRAVQQARAALQRELATNEAQAAFAFLGTGKLPETSHTSVDDPRVEALLQAVADRKPEKDIAPLVLSLSEEVVQKAIDTTDADARRFEVACEPVSQAIRSLDKQVIAAVRPAVAFHQAVVAVDSVLAGLPPEQTKALDEVRSAAGTLARSDEAVRTAAEELSNTIKMARLDFDARRYRREATFNQRIAGLYEIQVRKHSIGADRHRDRSKMFFYGMLFAQAGVAIASMSLAARQRSVLWGLAGLAGSVAVAFSLYVYLYR